MGEEIGRRIQIEVLSRRRAEYGERIVRTAAAELSAEFGRGFSEKNLRHMIRFAERFPDREIVSALSRQLPPFVAARASPHRPDLP